MAKNPHFELDLYPPFSGFPRKGILFLKDLKRNNRREWFEKHKEVYEMSVKLPMQSLISSLQPHFNSFAPEFEVHPKRSLFRIYRDVRFSKDKRPYKTHVAAHFVLRGKPKGVEGSGYYVHIEPGEVFVGAGIYMPDGDQLKRIRRAIAEKSEDFIGILTTPSFKRVFKKLEGEKLQRIPQGYDSSHPMAEWLMYKQFFAGVSWPEKKSLEGKFAEEVAAAFEAATPLVRFLNTAMS